MYKICGYEVKFTGMTFYLEIVIGWNDPEPLVRFFYKHLSADVFPIEAWENEENGCHAIFRFSFYHISTIWWIPFQMKNRRRRFQTKTAKKNNTKIRTKSVSHYGSSSAQHDHACQKYPCSRFAEVFSNNEFDWPENGRERKQAWYLRPAFQIKTATSDSVLGYKNHLAWQTRNWMKKNDDVLYFWEKNMCVNARYCPKIYAWLEWFLRDSHTILREWEHCIHKRFWVSIF